jgi:hypothetical protein
MYCYVGAPNSVYVVLSVGAADITVDTDAEFDGDSELASSFKVNIAVYGSAV